MNDGRSQREFGDCYVPDGSRHRRCDPMAEGLMEEIDRRHAAEPVQ